jgi:hypothetical protein
MSFFAALRTLSVKIVRAFGTFIAAQTYRNTKAMTEPNLPQADFLTIFENKVKKNIFFD